jgi:outer membrane receptor protein involved in Fe transport
MRFIGILIIEITLRSLVVAQVSHVTISGTINEDATTSPIPYVNVVLKSLPDSSFISGTVTSAQGVFTISGVTPGRYLIELSFTGLESRRIEINVGHLSEYLDLGTIRLHTNSTTLESVTIEGDREVVSAGLDRKTFTVEKMIVQSGGSLLQVIQNLPGVTVGENGNVLLRGSNRVTVLIDGKQTALTGFGNQTSLDNIPASAIEKIEVINNPTGKYDANGSAGIINIIYKKNIREGFNGKVGLAGGLGALWTKKHNFPNIRPQYARTPKVNPSISLNYRKRKTNLFLQADNLYTETLNKNEFVDRIYKNGDFVKQQTKRNRTTNVVTTKGGLDWHKDERNTITGSALYSSEKILDRGDEPFFNADLSERLRLWKFLEDEVKTTVTLSATWQHKYLVPGRSVTISYNYTFHREDEKYFFTNILPDYTGKDAFKLISDEHVTDVTSDYVHPLRYGKIETGLKFRFREIPTNMKFIPGLNSPLDVGAGGAASYYEIIPVAYGNYVFENEHFGVETGLRIEYVDIYYRVNPNHNTYKSDGYDYIQPFPSLRLTFKTTDEKAISFFYTRRVDRPNEVDIRIFPKYDDAEIIKIGNPALRPQFTNAFELGFKSSSGRGYFYGAMYHKRIEGTITRIGAIQPNSSLIYSIFQNAGKSQLSGSEIIIVRKFGGSSTLTLNLNGYYTTIEAFSVVNKYPETNTFHAAKQTMLSGSIRLNGMFQLSKTFVFQLSGTYLAPDAIPQGKTYSRYALDTGLKKSIQRDKGELFVNASDLTNTSRLKKRINGDGFRYVSTDYYETQVIRLGYNYKF